MQYYKFDSDGYYLEPVIAEYNEGNPQPDDVTDMPLPQPCFRPRWNGTTWVEEAPKPEISDDESAIWDSEAQEWRVEPVHEPVMSDIDALKIAVAEIARKTGVALEAIPEEVLERMEEKLEVALEEKREADRLKPGGKIRA